MACRKNWLSFCVALMLILSIPVLAPAKDRAKDLPFIINRSDLKVGDLISQMQADDNISVMAEIDHNRGSFDVRTEQNRQSTGKKSPLKAFVYSAIIPGAGQFYNGSKVKAALFLGIEALTWTGYASYHHKGDVKTDEFESFANTHWSQTDYEDYLFANWGVRDDELVLNEYGYYRFTHHLPDTKTQQYFEMIGKYDQFVYGWDDRNPNTYDTLLETVIQSNNRQNYEDMRHDANKMFDRATASLIVMMANHLISGFEAALSASRHNRKIEAHAERLSFRAYTVKGDFEYFPMLTMTYRF